MGLVVGFGFVGFGFVAGRVLAEQRLGRLPLLLVVLLGLGLGVAVVGLGLGIQLGLGLRVGFRRRQLLVVGCLPWPAPHGAGHAARACGSPDRPAVHPIGRGATRGSGVA
ncbi:hypothetical protein DMP14_24900 [Pseudonocardia sp. Ae707_Ps2]